MNTVRIGLLVVTLILFYTPALANHPQGPPDEVPICHYAGTANQITLTVSERALDKHMLEHGDDLGACTPAAASSIACPCFDDLTQVGFTDQASCTNVGGNVDIFQDFSSGFIFAEASETTCGLAIIDSENETEILEPVISGFNS